MTAKGFGKQISLFIGGITVAIATSFIVTTQPAQKAQAQNTSALTVKSDIQEANTVTGVVTARGNVRINYPARDLQATAAQAQYFSEERTLVLTGNVYVLQEGNSMRAEKMTYAIDEGRFIATPARAEQVESIYLVQDDPQSEENNEAIALPEEEPPVQIVLPEDE